MRRRGISLTGVLALTLFFFVLFAALSHALRMNRHRLSQEKHRQAAVWLSVSGADWAENEFAKGRFRAGDTFRSPDFQQGRFELSFKSSGGLVLVICEGIAANQNYTTERKVSAR
jgi:type II secretory pathway component PulK